MTGGSEPLQLLKSLIRRSSVTPDDAGCQKLIIEALQGTGAVIDHYDFNDTSNLCMSWGSGSPHLLLLGHTDIVPAGPEASWNTPPFEAVEKQGMLYGRGSADMKASVAAMVAAIRNCQPIQAGSGRLSLLLTSDEEGDATDGVQRAAPELIRRHGSIDYCLVGEPSSINRLGDLIRIGRRGSLTGYLTVSGVQGHAAYPHLADNPIHKLMPALNELIARQWDSGSDRFPPTSFQVTNINAGTGAANVIPGDISLCFNFRYATCQTAEGLMAEVAESLGRHDIDASVDWRQPSLPFYSEPGALRDAVIEAIDYTVGSQPDCDTGGGTSDGRFIAPHGAEVIELGPVNATIHQANECIRVKDLDRLTDLYTLIIKRILNQVTRG